MGKFLPVLYTIEGSTLAGTYVDLFFLSIITVVVLSLVTFFIKQFLFDQTEEEVISSDKMYEKIRLKRLKLVEGASPYLLGWV